MSLEEQPIETKEQVDLLCKLAIGVRTADVERLLTEIERTGAEMPFVDPTGFMAISRTLPHHRTVVRAFLAFRRTLDDVLTREAAAVAHRAPEARDR